MTQRDDDWARVIIGWIERAEADMDEAYSVGDGPAYTTAARWRDEMRLTLQVIDPTARMRFAAKSMNRSMQEFGRAMVTASERAKAMRSAVDSAVRPEAES